MRYPSPFEPSRKSINWAREAINELDSALGAYFAGEPLTQVVDIDPDTGHKLLKRVLTAPLPDVIGRKATESMNNLRHSFDQAINGACTALGKRPSSGKEARRLNFPWSTDPIDLGHFLKNRPIPPELWDELKRQQPYPRGEGYAGGDDLIRGMATLANTKHNTGLTFDVEFAGMRGPSMLNGNFMAIPSKLQWDTVKQEVVVATFDDFAEVYDDYTLRVYVAFDVTGILKRTPLQSALGAFLDKAQRVVDALEQECARIASH